MESKNRHCVSLCFFSTWTMQYHQNNTSMQFSILLFLFVCWAPPLYVGQQQSTISHSVMPPELGSSFTNGRSSSGRRHTDHKRKTMTILVQKKEDVRMQRLSLNPCWSLYAFVNTTALCHHVKEWKRPNKLQDKCSHAAAFSHDKWITGS